ncbi:MAG: cell envelope biogenesis protein TolA [Pseudomonadota bacterium]
MAVIAHVALFGLLSVGFLATPNPESLKSTPIEVSLTDEVALESSAPDASTEAPAAKLSPLEAPVEPDSAPPEPDPQPVTKPQPTPPRPVPAPDAKPDRRRPDRSTPNARTPDRSRAAGGGLPDYAKEFGTSNQRSESESTRPQASAMSAEARANIGSAIARQIQPCANRQVDPGPGANRIKVTVQLHLNRDGSLIDRPTVVGAPQGVDPGNERYLARVKDLAIATFMGCAPLRGLPLDLWDVPRGWRNFKMTYKLPG